jgi:hypothetical protein
MEDLERDVVRLPERVARLERRREQFDGIMPAAVNIAVTLFVIVQLLGVDDRLDGLEQRMTAVERRLGVVERNQAPMLDALADIRRRLDARN